MYFVRIRSSEVIESQINLKTKARTQKFSYKRLVVSVPVAGDLLHVYQVSLNTIHRHRSNNGVAKTCLGNTVFNVLNGVLTRVTLQHFCVHGTERNSLKHDLFFIYLLNHPLFGKHTV